MTATVHSTLARTGANAAPSISDALRNFDSAPDSAHVRQPVVQALFACSSATVWRMVKRGQLPPPKKLSERVTAWNVGQLRAVLAEVA
jgi:predicted DNA-binding transcriptional regulator AlpA